MQPIYLSIQPEETGKRIKQLLAEQGYTIRDIQGAFGFENPQAIYKWISGKSLPSIDNFVILSKLLHTSIDNILVIDGDFSFINGLFNHWYNDSFFQMIYHVFIDKKLEEMSMKNFWKLHGLSFLTVPYMYIDHKDYLADSLFAENKISVKFGKEMVKDGSPYRIVFCRVKKKDVTAFEHIFPKLTNKMLLLGYHDYLKACEDITDLINAQRGIAA